jgi:hypothetical protein
MPDHPPHCVLITIVNSNRVVDSGSGIVVCHREEGGRSKTYVLTCAHNLKARRLKDVEGLRDKEERKEAKYDSDILVNGSAAQPIADPEMLERLDLTVLEVEGMIGAPAAWGRVPVGNAAYSAAGFVGFFGQEFVPLKVERLRCKRMSVLTSQGLSIETLKLEQRSSGDWFRKGMSGGPVHDSLGKVVAVARMLDVEEQPKTDKPGAPKTRKGPRKAYAIPMTSDVMGMVRQLCKCDFAMPAPDGRKPIKSQETGSPPPPPTPKQKSIDEDDIQKDRWGGKSKDGPFGLKIANVEKYSRYFLFDAIVEASEGGELIGPFIFHLHDSYKPGVIWVRKTDGKRAGLFEIGSNGVYSIGVQFRAKTEERDGWFQLEYDLSKYAKGELKQYKGKSSSV